MHLFHIVNIDIPIDIDSFINEFENLQPSFKLIKFENDIKLGNGVLDKQLFFDHFKGYLNKDVKFIVGITQKALDNNFFSMVK